MRAKKNFFTDLIEINLDFYKDNRGLFSRLFCHLELSKILENRNIAQINISETKEKGSIRGLHYQRPPNCEMKFVYCLKGEIYDVVTDIRRNSKNYLKWHASKISSSTGLNGLIIPEGFAHGFQTLTDDVLMLYLHTVPYSKESEGCIRFDDPSLKINWPLRLSNISEKDERQPFISEDFLGLDL